MRFGWLFPPLLSAALAAPAIPAAAAADWIQPVVQAGDGVGRLTLRRPAAMLGALGLNDAGQLLFEGVTTDYQVLLALADAGERTLIAKHGDVLNSVRINSIEATCGPNNQGQFLFSVRDLDDALSLFQYTDGRVIPIVVPGGPALGGSWSRKHQADLRAHMNQRGDAVFRADVTADSGFSAVTFFWDHMRRQAVPLATLGSSAGRGLTFADGGDFTTSLNNRGQVAFVATVKSPAGWSREEMFRRDPDGPLRPVAFEGQTLAGGEELDIPASPELNDAGVVAFVAARGDAEGDSAYVWKQGRITPLVRVGTLAPGGGRIAAVNRAWLNDRDDSLLVEARTGSLTGPAGLYRAAGGRLTAVAVPGQSMPGGGAVLKSPNGFAISPPNAAGAFAFLAELDRGKTGLYLVAADGRVSLLLKTGMPTPLGRAAGFPGSHLALNDKGQVAVAVQIATPASPMAEAILLLSGSPGLMEDKRQCRKRVPLRPSPPAPLPKTGTGDQPDDHHPPLLLQNPVASISALTKGEEINGTCGRTG
jgi:hypothetical protein